MKYIKIILLLLVSNSLFGQQAALTGGGAKVLQTIHQVLVNGNNTRRNIVFDSITTHPPDVTGYSKNYITINPLDTLNKGNANGPSPWLLGISTNGGEIHSNQVMYMGWNITPGGGPLNAGRPGIGEGWENWWRPGNGNTASKTEKHEVWIRRDGFPVRLSSFECDNTTTNGDAGLYHTINKFSLRKGEQTNPDYFSIQGDALGSGTQTTFTGLGGNLTMGYAPNQTNADFTINNSKTTGSPSFQLSGFKQIGMSNGTAGTVVSWGSPQFIFSDGSFMQFTSSLHRWYTVGLQPIILRSGNFQNLQCWNDGTNFGVEVGIHGIGQNSRLSVFGKSATSSDFCARFQKNTPGQDILAIRNDGKIGVNNNTPTEALDVTGNVKFSGALMPNNTAGTSGQVLTSAGAGTVPTWQTNTSESTTIGAFQSSGNSNGLTLSGTDIRLHAATVSTPGGVNVGQQTFGVGADTKIFNGTGSGQITVDGNTDNTVAGINFTQQGTDLMGIVHINSSDASNAQLRLALEQDGGLTDQVTIGTLNDSKGMYSRNGLYEDVTTVTTSPYTVLYGDRNIYLDEDVTTVNLQAIGTSTAETKIGRVIYFFNDNATNVTITPNGSETINDSASLTLLPNTGVTLLAVTGTKWVTRD